MRKDTAGKFQGQGAATPGIRGTNCKNKGVTHEKKTEEK